VNASETISSLPDEWLADIHAEVESASSEDWSEFRIFSPGAYVNVTGEQMKQWQNDKILAYRTGIESLRVYFAENQST